MANIFDGAAGGGVPPVMAQGGGRVSRPPIMHMLRRLPPQHPIFRKFPALLQVVHGGGQGVQGGPKPFPSPTGGPMPFTPPDGGGVGPSFGGGPTHEPAGLHQGFNPPQEGSGGAGLYIPGDMSGYQDSGYDLPQDPNAAPVSPGGGIRNSLLERFRANVPALTSRAALQQHLQRAGRVGQQRQPILPIRQPLQQVSQRQQRHAY